MRYERLTHILNLARSMAASHQGMTLAQIVEQHGVSRRTAERLRDAVDAAFGLEPVPSDDRFHRWRVKKSALHGLLRVEPTELAALAAAAESLEGAGFGQRAGALRDLDEKLRVAIRPAGRADFDAELEAAMSAEGHAMRPGPRQCIDGDVVPQLRQAIRACRVVEFRYLARNSGKASIQRAHCYGVLYGNRAFLVARASPASEMRLWRLANISKLRITPETFQRDRNFDLRTYAKQSFGTFQERPAQVVLRFGPKVAQDAAAFLFHPDQQLKENEDGSLSVRFKAGGIDEMCWHLFTWGADVAIEKPVRLRRRLAQMCAALAAHHGEL